MVSCPKFLVVATMSAAVFLVDASSSLAVAVPSPFIPRNERAAKELRQREEAGRLYGNAIQQVGQLEPTCMPGVTPSQGQLLSDAPQPGTLDLVAAFRRPAVPGDALPTPRPVPFGDTYVDFVRAARTSLGQTVRIVPIRMTNPGVTTSPTCRDAITAEVRRLARTKSAVVRREVERIDREARAGDVAAAKLTDKRPDGISMAIEGKGGGGQTISGLIDTQDFAARGLTGGYGSATSATIIGIVPDGVASVRFDFPKVLDLGRLYKPVRHRKAARIRAAVTDNVYALRSPRPVWETSAVRVTWFSAGGKKIKVIKPEPRPG